MVISDYIKVLQKAQEKFGDLEVRFECCTMEDTIEEELESIRKEWYQDGEDSHWYIALA